MFFLLSSCQRDKNSQPNPPAEPLTLVLYDWEGDIPQPVLEEFTARTGLLVDFQAYSSSEIAKQDLLEKKLGLDVVVVDNDFIPQLVEKRVLHELDFENLSNFRNISINFRDLVYDPDNRYSVPFNWGTTGIVTLNRQGVLTPQNWADLWETPDTVKIGLRTDVSYDAIAIAKLALGYSINECDPDKLNAAYKKLIELAPHVVLVDADPASAIQALESGQVDLLLGWADDVYEAREQGLDGEYILPRDGTMLWGDSFVIPANSIYKHQAEALINFLLEPKVAAAIIQHNNYANANEQAADFLPLKTVVDPIIFPTNEILKNAEVYMPISEACSSSQSDFWQQFIQMIP